MRFPRDHGLSVRSVFDLGWGAARAGGLFNNPRAPALMSWCRVGVRTTPCDGPRVDWTRPGLLRPDPMRSVPASDDRRRPGRARSLWGWIRLRRGGRGAGYRLCVDPGSPSSRRKGAAPVRGLASAARAAGSSRTNARAPGLPHQASPVRRAARAPAAAVAGAGRARQRPSLGSCRSGGERRAMCGRRAPRSARAARVRRGWM